VIASEVLTAVHHPHRATLRSVPDPRMGVSAPARRIVVPVANLRDPEQVTPTATWFARQLRRPMELVTVIGTDNSLDEAARALGAATDRLHGASGQPVSGRLIISDETAAAVVEACRDRLVVMETSASPFRDRHVVGSHAARILARSTQPVVMVGPAVDSVAEPAVDSITVALSGDSECLSSLPVARTLSAAMGLKIRNIHVLEPTDDHVMVDAAGQARLWFPDRLHTSVPVEIQTGSDIDAVLADVTETSLLVMGSHARCGLRRMAEGSAAFDVVEHARGPVVLIGPQRRELPKVPPIAFSELTYTPLTYTPGKWAERQR